MTANVDLREWFDLDTSKQIRFCKIKYFCKVKDGTHDTPKYVENSTDSFPLITSKDIVNGEIDFSNVKHIAKEDYIKINQRSDVERFDVIMPMIGTIGNPTVVNTLNEFSIKNVALFKTSPNILKAKYLRYLLDSHIIKKQFEFFNRGGVQSFVSLNVLENLYIFERDDLDQIVSYLDDKTSEIDSLIADKEKLIELLEEKRQAIITEVVTKGLNPNVKMKDSGVEWIGEIPEHWNIVSVRNLLRNNIIEYQDGNHGELHPTSDDYVDDGIPFIMANNIRNNRINFNSTKFISKERAERLRIGFSISGDILLTHKGTVGEVAVVPNDIPYPFIMLTPQVTYYRIHKENVINNEFMAFYFKSNRLKNQLKLISSMQSTRDYIGLVAQREFKIILPPVEEQNNIVNYLNKAEVPIIEVINIIHEQINKLKDYRQSLIYEAVTGKIDVRDYKKVLS